MSVEYSLWFITIIPWAHIEYEKKDIIAELATIISYPTSVSGIIFFLLKMPQNIYKSSQIFFVRTNGVLQ